MKPRRLGRGLDFLLSGPGEASSQDSIEEIEITEISSNPWQPRTRFGESELESLAESIRRHGIMQPILVRKTEGGKFQLVAGERRLLAAKRAGLTRIPALVRPIDDQEMLVVALVENLQRQDLGAIERARAFKRLIDEQSLTHDQISNSAGLARSTVTNSLRLLELDGRSIDALENGQITEGHARTLLGEADLGLRARLLDRMISEKLSVRQIEHVMSSHGFKGSRGKTARATADARALERRLSDAIGLKVAIQERGRGGRIVVKYANLAEFDQLFMKLVGNIPAGSGELE